MLDFKKYIDFALAHGADDIEIYLAEIKAQNLRIFKGEVDSLLSSQGENMAIRTYKNGKVGFTYTSNVSEDGIKAAILEAIDNAQLLGTKEMNQLPRLYEQYPEVDIYSEELKNVPVEWKIDFCLAAEKAALNYDQRIVMAQFVGYYDREICTHIVNSKGLDKMYKRTNALSYVYALARENDQTQTGMGIVAGKDTSKFDPVVVGEEAAKEAITLLGAQPVASQKVPVLFKNRIGSMLFSPFAVGFQADRVQKDKSLFKGKIGQEVASPLVTLIDNGLYPDGPNTAPFDDEGVPSQETIVIEKGILKSYLYDSYTASIDGVKSTGNARRSEFWELPEVSPSNLYLETGDATLDELIAGVEDGLLVLDLNGTDSGSNPISGDFSVGASGIWIKDGKLTHPVREITIAGNFIDLLKNIVKVGNDLDFTGDSEYMGTPSFLVKELAVSGQ